jgi:hypothetical protein
MRERGWGHLGEEFCRGSILSDVDTNFSSHGGNSLQSREGGGGGETKDFLVGGINMRQGSYMQSRKRSEMGWGTVDLWGGVIMRGLDWITAMRHTTERPWKSDRPQTF